MGIIFGHRSYVIKRLTGRDLGTALDENILEIQLRQKYAHVYFIPVFPLGQVWVVKKNNRKLYDVPEKLKGVLKQKYPSRVHIGAFALPILLILGYLIFVAVQTYNMHKFEEEHKERLLTEKIKLSSALDTLKTENTFVVFSSINSEILCKVLQVEKNKLFLGKIADMELDSITEYYYPDEVEDYIKYKSSKITDSLWVEKKVLKNAIRNENSFFSATINGISKYEVNLDRIFALDNAYFAENKDSYAETEYYKEYVNRGLDVVLDSIVPDIKNESWKLSKNKVIKYGDIFAIKTESNNSATLFYHVMSNAKKHSIKVTRNSIEYKSEYALCY